MTLDSIALSQGATVHGTAVIRNDGSIDANDATYVVRIVGKFDSRHIPSSEYVSKAGSTFVLKAGATTSISFDIVVPKTVAGNDLALEVQAQLTNGMQLGWKDVPITVTGSSSLLSVPRASVAIGTTTYASEAGPTVHPGETASLVVAIKNPLSTAMTVTPAITVFDRTTDGGKPLVTARDATFTIAPAATVSRTFALPLFSHKSGVYAGKQAELEHIDAAVTRIRLPFYFADQIYDLRGHIDLVRQRLAARPVTVPMAAQ